MPATSTPRSTTNPSGIAGAGARSDKTARSPKHGAEDLGRARLVILEAIANYEDEPGDSVPNLERLVELSGLDAKTCSVGLKALITVQPPLIAATDVSTFSGWDVLDIDLLERGRRAVGQWPNENPADELLELLRERSETAATDEERGRWKTALDVLRALPGKALTEVTIALIRREAGLWLSPFLSSSSARARVRLAVSSRSGG